jgi:glycosyltransferase involved in cell wall biosynthesis
MVGEDFLAGRHSVDLRVVLAECPRGSVNIRFLGSGTQMRAATLDVFGAERDVLLAENVAYLTVKKVPKISLVVCSRNRGTSLSECLSHISNLRCKFAWELILVDNGSTDATREVMLSYLGNLGVPGLYIYDDTPGNAAGRNAAFSSARADIIAFIDDDCYIDQDHLAKALKHFRDPQLGFCTGRTRLFDPADYPITILESTRVELYRPGSFIRYGKIAGANMVFRRETLQEIRGFDEAFGAGTPFACEDWEIAARAAAAGWGGGYFPDVIVWHHHKRKLKEAARLNKYYEFGAGAAYCKLLLSQRSKVRTFYFFVRHLGHHVRYLHPTLLCNCLFGAGSYGVRSLFRRL